jgi:small-conductance mechanosensitive channel
MGISENLRNVTSQMQQGAKNAGITVTQRALRFFTGFFVGAVLSLIIQEFTQSGTLILVFLILLFTAIFYRLLRPLSIWQILVVDVICVLIANTLRMYIQMAP